MRTHSSEVTDDVALQGADVGGDVSLLDHLMTDAGSERELLRHEGQHEGDIGVGLGDGDAGLKARERLIAQVSDEGFVAVEAEGEDQFGLEIDEMKSGRHDADYQAGFAIGLDGAAPTLSGHFKVLKKARHRPISGR
jgi:hypothetical protein